MILFSYCCKPYIYLHGINFIIEHNTTFFNSGCFKYFSPSSLNLVNMKSVTNYYLLEEVPKNMFCISSATENIIIEVPQKILI